MNDVVVVNVLVNVVVNVLMNVAVVVNVLVGSVNPLVASCWSHRRV